MQDRGILSVRQMLCVKKISKVVAWGSRPPGVSAIIPKTLNLCSNFLSIVNFEALLLLNGAR